MVKGATARIVIVALACALALSGCGAMSGTSSPSNSSATFTPANTISALESSLGTQFTRDATIPLWWNGVTLADGFFTTDALNLHIMIYLSASDLQGDPQSLQVMQQTGNRSALQCVNLWIVYPPGIEQRVSEALNKVSQNLGIKCGLDAASLKLQGKVALTDTELRDVVVSKHLTVYWAGPMDGAKYALIANISGMVIVRYLPGGVGLNDTKTLFRSIATYTQKNAFSLAQSDGSHVGNVGFINADGNAVYYVKAKPTNVYIGIKGKDIQVEIYDPDTDIALALGLLHNQIQQIS